MQVLLSLRVGGRILMSRKIKQRWMMMEVMEAVETDGEQAISWDKKQSTLDLTFNHYGGLKLFGVVCL